MWNAFMLVHILGAVLMGFYGIAPFFASKLKTSSAPVQEGVLSTMAIANRIGQAMLVVQLLTGGYIMSQTDKSVLWMILTTVVFLAIGAFSGIMGKAIKTSMVAAKGNRTDAAALDKVKLFSILSFVAFIVIVVLMVYNEF